MKAATRKLRSPAKWHGGKTYLARRIIEKFTPHDTYVEPFVGGGSILLNKTPVPFEAANDLNTGLVRMWVTLRNLGSYVAKHLAETPYSEESWEKARVVEGCDDDIEHAVAFIIANRMSRGGLGRDFAWSERLRGKRRPGGPVPGELNSWDTFVNDDLPAAIERIKTVVFSNTDAISVIREYEDEADTLIYCDPPYLHETRTHTKAYDHEMTREQHAELLGVLLGCKSKVFLSGYRSGLYDEALSGWTRHEFDMPNHSGQGKTKGRRIECLWENHP